MESDAGPTRPGEWRRGWPIVAAAAIGIGTGPGLYQNLTSLFIPGMVADFGWTRGEVATAAGLGLLGGLAVPFLGRVADRLGARPMIVAAMLLLSLCYLGFATLQGSLWLYQLIVVGVAFAVPGTSAIVYGKLVARRFVANRGLALGVATSGISVSSLALAPVIGWVVAQWGWRAGVLCLAALIAFVALPAVLLLLRRMDRVPPEPDAAAPAGAPPGSDGMTGAETRRDSRYWRLAATAALINIASIGLVTSLVPFGLDRGLSGTQAAWLVASFAASQVVGRLVMGYLVDRFRPQLTAAAFATLSALAFVALQLPAPGFALLLVLVFVAGLMNGAEHDVLPFLTARMFGLRAYGEVYGLMVMISLAGTATGVVAFGRLHDATGSYDIALAISAAAVAASALIYLTLRERPLPRPVPAVSPA